MSVNKSTLEYFRENVESGKYKSEAELLADLKNTRDKALKSAEENPKYKKLMDDNGYIPFLDSIAAELLGLYNSNQKVEPNLKNEIFPLPDDVQIDLSAVANDGIINVPLDKEQNFQKVLKPQEKFKTNAFVDIILLALICFSFSTLLVAHIILTIGIN